MHKYLYIHNYIDINIGTEEIILNDFKNQVTHILVSPYKEVFDALLQHQVLEPSCEFEEMKEFIINNNIGLFLDQKFIQENGGVSTLNLRVYEREMRIKTLTIFASEQQKVINGCFHAKGYQKNFNLALIDRLDLFMDKIIINIGYQPPQEILKELKRKCSELIIILPCVLDTRIDSEYTYIISINKKNIYNFDSSHLHMTNVFFNAEDQPSYLFLHPYTLKIVNRSYLQEHADFYQQNLELKPGHVTEYRRFFHPCLSMQVAMDLNGDLYYCSEFDISFMKHDEYTCIKEIFNKPENYAIWTSTIAKNNSCQECGYRYHCNDCIVAHIDHENYNCMKRDDHDFNQ